MVFFDASVLIAATLAGHPAHERAARRLLRAQPGKDCFAAVAPGLAGRIREP